ncbi:MAG: response regulator [Desulfobacterales bacterium]|nr:response regulator [Desulfobacterales bacterium]
MKPTRVLLVDDEARFVETLARILLARGFAVDTAPSGEAALSRLEQGGGMDVAVVDLRMPGMDGIATLQAIKGIDSRIQVIMLTGHGSLETGVEAIREGAFDYLMKPCDPSDLIEKINEAVTVEAIRAHPVLWSRTRAAEVLFHPFRRLEPHQPLADALAMFAGDWGGGAAPEALFVVDAQGRLRGMVTRRDLVGEAGRANPGQPVTWETLGRHPEWLPNRRLEEILHPEIITTDSGAPLVDVARCMFHNHCRSMPVVDGERFMGVVRLKDVLAYLDTADLSLDS